MWGDSKTAFFPLSFPHRVLSDDLMCGVVVMNYIEFNCSKMIYPLCVPLRFKSFWLCALNFFLKWRY